MSYVDKTKYHCATVSQNKCSSCVKGYKYINGMCEIGEDLCMLYDVTTNVCITCTEHAMKDGGYCKKDLSNENCIEHSDHDCTKCTIGLHYDNDNNHCEVMVSHCLEYNGKVCSVCQEGYYLSLDNLCYLGDVNNCKEYIKTLGGYDKNTCAVCFDGFVLNTKDNTCTKNGYIPHCKDYESGQFYGLCSKCGDGYGLSPNNDNCELCLTNCEKCTTSNYCLKCKKGFYNTGKMCEKCNKSCDLMTNLINSCSQCGCVVKPNNGKSSCVETENCEEYDGSGNCEVCSPKYNKNGNICELDQNGCLQRQNQNKNEKCLQCQDGYFMLEDFTCSKCDESCETCFYDKTNCLTFSQKSCESKHCEDCHTNSKICEKCDSFSKIENGNCLVRFCETKRADGVCLKCVETIERDGLSFRTEYLPSPNNLC
ncbi:hypothetical protein EIN_018230 [Entamoeba invadens IP1]|uniref:hypothetical protein n=1 Tax=Entamoeba invadens IP1 TaxID=370355 RepID=UPI0002C3CE15|nr:hypothetical protein EIN_018230 [Entamoeba invadens IP1]ELP90474.1 hypothetical protein EIN_018230 [Entamoeba invadens IP1]|eukprot:XP_004257245.1 hypothetical protein EIN_018230 [Entamoeba invadens IP1]